MQCSLPHRDDLEIAPVHCMEENFPRGAFPLPAPLNSGALQDVGGTAATAFPVGSSEPRKQRRQEEEAEAGAAARGCLHTSLLGLAPSRDLSSLRGPGVGTPRTGLRTGTPAARPAMPGRALPGAAPRTLAAWLWVCALGRLCTAGFPETPRPCQAPQQWEGRQVLFLQSSGHNSRALLSYDGPNQRLRVLDEKKALIPCKRLFEYILLYKEGVMFQIEQATKQCSKIPLTVAWDPLDIPDNSTFEDQYSIGGPQEQITVQEWSNRKSARTYETWIGVYTAKDCYPVQETFIQNYTVVLSTRFFDVQLGIKDPSVFTPPSTCQMAQTEKMSEDCAW